MNHKRKGPKSTRGGCLLCKPWKHQSYGPKKYASGKASLIRLLLTEPLTT